MTSPAPEVLGIHAERVAGDPQCVRWVIPRGRVAVGRVSSAPGRLGELLAEGTLSEALSEPGAVWLRLRDGLSWSPGHDCSGRGGPGWGATVQRALRDALAEPAGWVIEAAGGDVLTRVIGDLLRGSVGDFVRSHGGSVSVEPSGDEAVAVRLGGACEHCPAAAHTLRHRLMGELRRRCPDVAELGASGGVVTLRLAG